MKTIKITKVLTFALTVLALAASVDANEDNPADDTWKVDQFNTQKAIYLAEDLLPGFTDDIEVLVGIHDRGWASKANKRIVIPMWAFAKDIVKPKYSRYYVCHEMSHIETMDDTHDHGDNFQETLTAMCPEVAHYESEYKAEYE